MSNPKNIPVLSLDGELLSYTHPARARKLLRSGKFTLYSKDPFTVQLTESESVMARKSTTKKTSAITNFSEYFKNARDNFQDIYIQNISNTQISMQVMVGVNQLESIIIPKTRKPYNLCQDVPFSALSECMDLRKLVNRRPEVLRLITEEEYHEFFEKLASRNQTSASDEIDRSLELKRTLTMKPRESGPKPKTLDELALEKQEDLEVISLNPQIVGICAKVGLGLKESEMMPANEIIEELHELVEDLSRDDWEFIQQNGHWKTVKNFANKALTKFDSEEE